MQLLNAKINLPVTYFLSDDDNYQNYFCLTNLMMNMYIYALDAYVPKFLTKAGNYKKDMYQREDRIFYMQQDTVHWTSNVNIQRNRR